MIVHKLKIGGFPEDFSCTDENWNRQGSETHIVGVGKVSPLRGIIDTVVIGVHQGRITRERVIDLVKI